jgi:hypothetical protein
VSKHGRQPSDDADELSDRELDDARRRCARRRAVGCALVAVPLPGFVLVSGLHLGPTWVLLIVAVHFAIGWGINHLVLHGVVDRSLRPDQAGWLPGLPRKRHLAAWPFAVGVLFLAPLCLFDRDIEARHEAARPENWAARQQALVDEDVRLRAVIAKPLMNADDDPEVVSLQKQLDQARNDIPQVRQDVICEGDGTCGTGRVGQKERYEEKKRRRDELQRDIDNDLPQAIAARTKAVQGNRDAATETKILAERRSGEIRAELAAPPQWSDQWYGRWQAFDRVAEPRWKVGAAVVVAFLAVLLYLVLDVFVLRAAARGICTLHVARRSPTVEVVAPRAEIAGPVVATNGRRTPLGRPGGATHHQTIAGAIKYSDVERRRSPTGDE